MTVLTKLTLKNKLFWWCVNHLRATQRSANTYVSLCPWHAEKIPSFSLAHRPYNYHCFGCGKQGSMLKLALKILLKKFNRLLFN